ncbi:MAG: hydrogenase maturation protease [Acidobacteriota bacterium]
MTPVATTLILGWGNPGRLDDGLGPAFIEAVSKIAPPGVALDADYQLTMEDAARVAHYDRVVFVDADRSGPAPFSMRPLTPSADGGSFTTHSVAPGAVLSLCRDLFHSTPEAWLLGIRGYEFDRFGEGLSEGARANLDQAVEFIRISFERTDQEVVSCQTPSA